MNRNVVISLAVVIGIALAWSVAPDLIRYIRLSRM